MDSVDEVSSHFCLYNDVVILFLLRLLSVLFEGEATTRIYLEGTTEPMIRFDPAHRPAVQLICWLVKQKVLKRQKKK